MALEDHCLLFTLELCENRLMNSKIKIEIRLNGQVHHLSNHNHMVVRHMVSVKILQLSKRRGQKLYFAWRTSLSPTLSTKV